MAHTNKEIDLSNVPMELLMRYYEHQYDRIEQLEDQRVSITNIVVSLSILAFTFGFNSGATGFSRIVGYAVLATIIIANLFAILFIRKNDSSIVTHQLRAKGILEIRAKELFKFDREIYDGSAERRIPGRGVFQVALHLLLLIVAIVMTIFWR